MEDDIDLHTGYEHFVQEGIQNFSIHNSESYFDYSNNWKWFYINNK